MKKIAFTIGCFLVISMGYYFLSYYPYKIKINFLVQVNKSKISNKTLSSLYEILILKEETNGKVSSFLLRTRAMMSVYNKFAFQERRDIPSNLWKLDRYLWTYISYMDMDIEDITSLYIDFRTYPNRMKIYEYSKVAFKKDINILTFSELKELYQMGK